MSIIDSVSESYHIQLERLYCQLEEASTEENRRQLLDRIADLEWNWEQFCAEI